MPNLVNKESTGSMPGSIILFPIAYIVILLALAILRATFSKHLPIAILYPFHQMPLSVVWFGALGGVVISLQGIFFHNGTWSNEYNYWHALSGVIGAVYGIFSYLFLVVVIKAATNQAIDYNSAIFALAAFTLGYAQRQFHELITKAFDLIFLPGKK